MIDIINRLKDLLNGNQSDRLIKEKSQQNRIADTNLLRHTVYKGDRTIQQLGQEPIENGVILNNQSLAVGDVMLPLAKGNVLRRVDNTNGGALLGTAYRDALESDYDANGNRRSSSLSRNGGNEPSNPNNLNKPKSKPDRVPPPFGCTPPPPKCFWSRNPIAPRGFQSHGSAVVNENGLAAYLHCVSGANAPNNLNCSFLASQKWFCLGGVCSPNPLGVYASEAECQAALVPPPISVFNPSGRVNGWYRKYITSATPSGFVVSEGPADGGLIKSTVYTYTLLSPTTIQRYINGIASGSAEGADGSNIISVNWYFVESGAVTSPLLCP